MERQNQKGSITTGNTFPEGSGRLRASRKWSQSSSSKGNQPHVWGRQVWASVLTDSRNTLQELRT